MKEGIPRIGYPRKWMATREKMVKVNGWASTRSAYGVPLTLVINFCWCFLFGCCLMAIQKILLMFLRGSRVTSKGSFRAGWRPSNSFLPRCCSLLDFWVLVILSLLGLIYVLYLGIPIANLKVLWIQLLLTYRNSLGVPSIWLCLTPLVRNPRREVLFEVWLFLRARVLFPVSEWLSVIHALFD